MNDQQKKITSEYARNLIAIADGAEWECHEGDGSWCAPDRFNPWEYLPQDIRLKPWSLGRTVNGHTLPDGREWHRNDWTQEMLPAPWRPLMRGEKREDDDEFFDGNECTWDKGLKATPMSGDHYHSRTTRQIIAYKPDPLGAVRQAIADGRAVQWFGLDKKWHDYDHGKKLPPRDEETHLWRIKPADIPLGPEDVPPGSVFIDTGEIGYPGWCMAISCSLTGIRLWGDTTERQWSSLMEGQLNRSLASGKWDPTAWESCRKEAP